MRRFVEEVDRGQTTLFPECLEDWIGEDNPVRVVDVFVEELYNGHAWCMLETMQLTCSVLSCSPPYAVCQ